MSLPLLPGNISTLCIARCIARLQAARGTE
mgnify:FL=1